MQTAKTKEEFTKEWQAHLRTFYHLYENLETKQEQRKFLRAYEKMSEIIQAAGERAFPF